MTMSRALLLLALWLLAPWLPATAGAAARDALPVYRVKVVRAYPHDAGAYTEGLFWKDGTLYESTGRNGSSDLRKVDLVSGEVLQRVRLPARYFGEGSVEWQGEITQLTWRDGVAFVFDAESFALKRTFAFDGEGWGMTRSATALYRSDGTATLREVDPATFRTLHRIPVTAAGRPVEHLNELEWVDGEIWANVWLTERIARIDPASGRVTGWIDLTGLLDYRALPDPDDSVPNGIAWDAAGRRLFVTGKHWPQLFEVTLVPAAAH